MSSVAEAEEALASVDEAWARHDVDGVVAHLSAAIRGFTAAGDSRRAAMVCVHLGRVYANFLGNLAASRAWFVRARRLVEHEPPCVEQGWAAVASIGCDVDDPAELRASAELALERARQFGDINLETKALADGGLALVQAGQIAEGMAMLDEAMALACGPADDITAAGQSVCSFFTACYFAADFERAASWADLLRHHGLISPEIPGAPAFLSGHCDSVQAALLVELGRWEDAAALLTRAMAEFEALMHADSWHPTIALAELRTRQGRLAEAEALLLGKDQSMQALLPTARLHLERGDHALALAIARRGLRAVRDDRLRAAELLTVVIDAELAAGNVDGALAACEDLSHLQDDLDVPVLAARGAAARARVLAHMGDASAAVDLLETTLDQVDAGRLPMMRATLLLDLARRREQAGDRDGAAIDAKAAAALLATLDVTVPVNDLELLERLSSDRPAAGRATLCRDGKWWVASFEGSSVRVPDTKGMRYVAELVATAGVERHVLDLVDRVEAAAGPGGPDRRSLGDAGSVLDSQARSAYRRRIEELRAEVDDALAAGLLEEAETKAAEIDQLVGQLAQAFGLGGRDRKAASAAERARLNVTRALRAATAKLVDALPGAGPALDRGCRTGLYCAYEPTGDDIRWIVQSGLNGSRPV